MANFLCSWMNCHDSRSRRIISAYIPVGDVARGHNCTDAGGRANHETDSGTPEETVFMKVIHKSSHLRLGAVSFGFLLLMSSLVSAESLREFQERQCKQGKQESCERAADMLEGEQHAERIVVLGDKFAINVDRSIREADKKPILAEAYVDVLNDYFKAEADNGVKVAVAADVINLCAEHFHDYWINRKMWWPTNDAGQPDWSTIYYYIVEHYYGYCLRSAL